MTSADVDQGLASCIRTIAGARPEIRLTVFQNQMKDAAGYVSAGFSKQIVVDRMYEAAVGFGLVEIHGIDRIQAIIADGLSHPTSHSNGDGPHAIAAEGQGRHFAAESRSGNKPKQADVLISLAEEAELFHTADGTPYADVIVSGHRETLNVRQKAFRRWLARRYFKETGGAPSSEGLQASLNVIEAKAHFDGSLRDVHVRVGGIDGKVYVDLVDEAWQAVEITRDGWQLIAEPPIRFRRAPGMKALPAPLQGGSIDLLRQFLNVTHEEDFVLVVAWLLACFRERGPFPVLLVNVEQGSAKSTFCAIVRGLIDPNSAPLRALPREDRDLFIAASNGHVLAFDNVSGMQPWISDTLCRLSTGGGFSARQLYSDSDEALFEAQRPALINGIDSVITRPDLADRAIFLTLDPIADVDRKAEHELVAGFERERALIIGALFDGVARGLRDRARTVLDRLPRMADFATWATACESAFWPAGTFAAAYRDNRADIVGDVLDADPVASAVIAYMGTQTGVVAQTASALLGALGEIVSTQQRKAKSWPDTPRALAGRLRRAAPFLRKAGIAVEFGEREGHMRARVIKISAADGADAQSSGCPGKGTDEKEGRS